MSGISFGQTIGMLENAMSGAGQAHGMIANNIANVNTPNFHRSDVSFKESLARSEATDGDPNELDVVTNDPRQIAIGGPSAGQPFAISTTVDESQIMRADGSNVDVDQEMAKLSINSAYAQTMAQLATNSFTRIKNVVSDTVA